MGECTHAQTWTEIMETIYMKGKVTKGHHTGMEWWLMMAPYSEGDYTKFYLTRFLHINDMVTLECGRLRLNITISRNR